MFFECFQEAEAAREAQRKQLMRKVEQQQLAKEGPKASLPQLGQLQGDLQPVKRKRFFSGASRSRRAASRKEKGSDSEGSDFEMLDKDPEDTSSQETDSSRPDSASPLSVTEDYFQDKTAHQDEKENVSESSSPADEVVKEAKIESTPAVVEFASIDNRVEAAAVKKEEKEDGSAAQTEATAEPEKKEEDKKEEVKKESIDKAETDDLNRVSRDDVNTPSPTTKVSLANSAWSSQRARAGTDHDRVVVDPDQNEEDGLRVKKKEKEKEEKKRSSSARHVRFEQTAQVKHVPKEGGTEDSEEEIGEDNEMGENPQSDDDDDNDRTVTKQRADSDVVVRSALQRKGTLNQSRREKSGSFADFDEMDAFLRKKKKKDKEISAKEVHIDNEQWTVVDHETKRHPILSTQTGFDVRRAARLFIRIVSQHMKPEILEATSESNHCCFLN